ncbi:hypothetical protein B0H16DRAFT_1447876 [Mycena metata]|uniref:F-box domain-containing protein n=1 Tax=Mycena metata TaxID=1033252 RepID=A0AAD7KA77_9AGAR|nr:hypothetical protein B0H16DRAFT_1447876 [Mycena metata]
MRILAELPYDILQELVDAYIASATNAHAAVLGLCAVTALLRRFIVDNARYWKYVRIRRTTKLESVMWTLEHSRSLHPLHLDIDIDGSPLGIADFSWIQGWMHLVHRLDVHLTDAIALDTLHSAMENCHAPALTILTLAFHVDIFRPGPNLYSPLQCRSWFQDDFPSLVELHLTCMVLPLDDLFVPLLAVLDIAAANPLYALHVDWFYQLLAQADNLTTLILHNIAFLDLPSDRPLFVCPNVSTLDLALRRNYQAAEVFNTLSFPALKRFRFHLANQSDIISLDFPAAYFSGVTHLTVINPRVRGSTGRSHDFDASGLFSMFPNLRCLDISQTSGKFVRDLAGVASASMAGGRGILFPSLRAISFPSTKFEYVVDIAKSFGCRDGSDGSSITLRSLRVGTSAFAGPLAVNVVDHIIWLKEHVARFELMHSTALNRTLTSINVLPVELLSAILVFANLPLSRHWWLFADFKLVASRVCRLWRSVIQSTSKLWTALPITRGTSRAFVSYYFSRSNGAAVEVFINLRSFSQLPGRVSDMAQTVDIKDVRTFCDTIIPVIWQYDSSVHRLLLRGDHVSDIQMVIASLTSLGGRYLTDLAISNPRRWMQPLAPSVPVGNNEILLPHIPHLSLLALGGVRVLEPTVIFASLTSLHLTGLMVPVAWDLLSGALASAVALHKLVMSRVHCPDCPATSQIVLASVEIFVFDSNGGDGDTKILKAILLPNVCQLTLRIMGGSARPFDPLKHVLSQIWYARFEFYGRTLVGDILNVARNIEVLALNTSHTFNKVCELLTTRAICLPKLKIVEVFCIVDDDIARSLVAACSVELFARSPLSSDDSDILGARGRCRWCIGPKGKVVYNCFTLPFAVPANLSGAWPDLPMQQKYLDAPMIF